MNPTGTEQHPMIIFGGHYYKSSGATLGNWKDKFPYLGGVTATHLGPHKILLSN
jgi:hypothetical protein